MVTQRTRNTSSRTAEYQRVSAARSVRNLAGIFTARLLQDVTDPAHRADQRGPRAVIDLAPQAVDHDIHDVRPAVELHVPDVLDDQDPRENAILVAHEVFQKLEFFVGQLDVALPAFHLPGETIDSQIVDLQHRAPLALGPRPPHESPDARQELGERERLGQIVVGAEVQAPDAVLDLAAGRQYQDRRGPARAADFFQDLDAVLAGQHEVEHDGVVIVRARQVRSFLPVEGDIHGHRLRLEPPAKKLSHALFVFDDEDPHDVPMLASSVTAAQPLFPRMTKVSCSIHVPVMSALYSRGTMTTKPTLHANALDQYLQDLYACRPMDAAEEQRLTLRIQRLRERLARLVDGIPKPHLRRLLGGSRMRRDLPFAQLEAIVSWLESEAEELLDPGLEAPARRARAALQELASARATLVTRNLRLVYH